MKKETIKSLIKLTLELLTFCTCVGTIWAFICTSISKLFPVKSEVFFGEDCKEKAEELDKQNKKNNKIQVIIMVLLAIPLYLVEVVGSYKIGYKYKDSFK